MNPMTNMKNVTKLSEQELKTNSKTSWHDQYKDSSWIFCGGLPYELTEGDVICIFSQYGEIVNLNLIRDKKTGKQKGFCFVCYEDQRSTVLAVDNFNGIKILGKTIRVDHVQNYKPPKDDDRYDDITRKLHSEGCAPIIEESVVKREEFQPSHKTRSPKRRRSRSRDRKRENSSERSDKHRHHHKKSSKKKDRKKRKRRSSTSSSESN